MSAPRRPPPDALLERYLANDLSPEARAAIDAALAESPEVRARLEALRADSAAFLIKHPPGPVAARLEPTRRRWLVWFPLVLASTAAAVLVVLRTPDEDESTTKGSITLTAYRQTADGGVEPLLAGARVVPGDKVRFRVTAPDGYVAVLSRDGAGTVSTYFPYGGATAAAFDSKQPLLPVAIALDGVEGRELVWAVHGPTAFSLAPLVKQLEAGKDPSGPGLSVTTLGWEKPAARAPRDDTSAAE
ncbi:MAG: DUF4384 domain-containing protein [Myxococcaceae bacterium]|jgi:hypothetical protein|nr:DUF4384 domain-containing protein [Myxococcaceae bacterium]